MRVLSSSPLPYGWAGATGRRAPRRAVTAARESRTRRGKQEVDDVRVLVVEDESYLADAIALGLRGVKVYSKFSSGDLEIRKQQRAYQ